MRKLVGALFLISLSSLLWAQAVAPKQSNTNTNVVSREPRTTAPARESAPKLTNEQRERAMQLLEGAEAGARGLDPASRAFALIQIARAYQAVDKKKAIELLEDALVAAKTVGQDDDRFKMLGSRLQQQAVSALVPLAPDKADELLPQLSPRSREQVFNSLLDYYEREKKMDHAVDMLYQLGQDAEMPYGSAMRVMQKLGPDQQSEKQQLFTVCLSSFQNHESGQEMRFGAGDFPSMIEEFYKELPAALVHQAIDAVLDRARAAAEKESKDGPTSISIASSKGAVQFNSMYNYHLFQLLPILKTIDPAEAERLSKEQNDVQTLLAKYPQGMQSVSGGGNGPGADNTSYRISSGKPSGSGAPEDGDNLMEVQREAQITRDAEEHPQDALANAATLQTPHLKTAAYVSIARSAMKKNPSVARQALQKAVDSLDKLPGEAQAMSTGEIARLYLQMKDEDSAKKVIEQGVAATDKIYRADINPDDPNKAPKAYWASTASWRSMLSLASQISPAWAATLLKDIPDEEIKTLVQLGVATALLQTQSPQVEIMSYTREGGRMMIMNNEERPR